MRRLALFGLLLLLPSCSDVGFPDFLGDVHTVQRNINAPVGDSQMIRRIRGLPTDLPPLTTEPGNVWPGAIAPEPTLETLEQQPGSGQQPEQPVPGSPDFRTPGSSSPPGGAGLQLQLPPMPNVPPPPRLAPPPPPSRGGVLQTPNGPAVSTGNGGTNFQQYEGPGNSGGGILIPNGNGTSTLVHPNGTVETVPSPGK
jgi:hypothetical protein